MTTTITEQTILNGTNRSTVATNLVAVDEPLNFQPVSPEVVVAADVTTTLPESVELDTVLVGDSTTLKPKVTNKLPLTGPDRKTSTVAIICGSFVSILVICLVASIPILKLIIGRRYADQCPLSWRIPHYLVVAGIVGLVRIILGIVENLLKLYAALKWKTPDLASATRCVSSLISIIGSLILIFLIGWFIAGCIWVFREWNEVQYKNPDQSDYCHPTLYRFAFWLLLISVAYYLFIGCRVCNQLRKEIINQKKGPAIPVPTTEP